MVQRVGPCLEINSVKKGQDEKSTTGLGWTELIQGYIQSSEFSNTQVCTKKHE